MSRRSVTLQHGRRPTPPSRLVSAGAMLHPTLLLDLSGTRCVALASDIVSVEAAGTGGDVRRVDLGERLSLPGRNGSSGTQRELAVRCEHGLVRFVVSSLVRFVELEGERFWSLPRLCKWAGCRPWVRGIALLEPAAGATESEMGLWLDLPRLAQDVVAEGTP